MEEYTAIYRTPTNALSVDELQLRALNQSWSWSVASSAYARTLQEEFGLPDQFNSWDEFKERTPIFSKPMLREILDTGSAEMSRRDFIWRSTGGSTAEPFSFPVFKQETRGASLDIWYGRSLLDIRPSDRLFLLWGHAHLFGSGLEAVIKRAKRDVFDFMLGYTRHSAYDTGEFELRRAADRILSKRPDYLLGYSNALAKLARVNSDRADDFAAIKMKAVIATAEGFLDQTARNDVGEILGAPVAMEYGTVETGPIAYEGGTELGYQVFWARHRLELRGGDGPNANELLVTSLFPRALPLFRYALGDLAAFVDTDKQPSPIQNLKGIVGRKNDIVVSPGGIELHSEAFTHCLRDIDSIRSYQIVTSPNSNPWIRYEAKVELSESKKNQIRSRLARLDPLLNDLRFERVEKIPLTSAGKHKMVLSE